METITTRARAKCDLALTFLKPYALRCRDVVAAQFKKQPHLLSAVLVVVLGFLAIVFQFPTKEGSASLAGALFGAGAAFIGAWVTENNRAAAEKIAEERQMEAARVYFTPELARIVAHQIHVLGRLVPNFIMASVGKANAPSGNLGFFPARTTCPLSYGHPIQWFIGSRCNSTD